MKAFAQTEYHKLLHKPYPEKVHEIGLLYEKLMALGSFRKTAEKVKEIKSFANKEGDESLVLEMELFWAYYLSENVENKDKSLRLLSRIINKAGEKNYPIQIRALRVSAHIYWFFLKQYEKAFEVLIKMGKILQRIDAEDYPDKVQDLSKIGEAYYYFQDYQKAIEYFKISTAVPETDFNSLDLAYAFNTLGLCYQKIGDFERSNQSLQKIIGLSNEKTREIWVPIAKGNIGYNHFLQQQYAKAIPLLMQDYKNAEATKDYGRAAGALIPLAAIYIKKKQLETARAYLRKAENFIRKSGQLDRLRLFYPVITKWYAAKKQTDRTMAYLDSSILAIKKYEKKYNGLKLMRAKQKVMAKQKKLEIEHLKIQSQIKISKRNLAITIVVFLLLGGSIVFIFRNKYLLKKQKIKELELKNTNKALGNAKTRLNSLTQKIRENNQVIQRLQKSKAPTDQETLEKLKKSTILTHEDWEEFQALFENAYPNYIEKLKENHSSLTPAERRCLCLEKLNLTHNEMAAVLGVSYNAIIVTKHRIRKKMGLENQKDLQGFVKSI